MDPLSMGAVLEGIDARCIAWAAATVKPGTPVPDIAFWLAGDETVEVIRQFMQDAQEVVTKFAEKHRVLVSPVKFTIKLPGEPRVPDTPKWLDHKCASIGRRMLSIKLEADKPAVDALAPVLIVAEATVLGNAPQFTRRTFVGDLSQKDLASLRAATRRAVGRQISDVEVDDIIEQYGPDAAFNAVLGTLKHDATKH